MVRREPYEAENWDPVFASRWWASIAAIYCPKLKQRAERTGLLESPAMQEKIRQTAAADTQGRP